uniref:Protein ZNF365 n=1 Tax=Anas platyrhynchos TaxID=8839 RepID=A0A8B9SM53_ANAPL
MQQDGAEQGGFPWPEPLPVAGPALPFRCPRCGERGRFGRGARVRAKFSRMVEAVDKTMEKRLDRLTGELAQKTGGPGVRQAPQSSRVRREQLCPRLQGAAPPRQPKEQQGKRPITIAKTRPLPVAGPALPFRCPRCGERGRFGRGARVRAKFSRMVEAVDKTMEKRLDRLTGELAQKTAELQEMREAFVKLSQKQQEVQRRERVLSRQVDVAVEMIAALKQRLSEFEEEAEKELQGKARLQHFIENLLQHVDLAERQLEYYQNQQIACSRIADVTRSCLTSNHVSHPFVVNDLPLSQPFEPHVGRQKDCRGLTRPAAKHHAAVRSPSPLPLWDGGEKWKVKPVS